MPKSLGKMEWGYQFSRGANFHVMLNYNKVVHSTPNMTMDKCLCTKQFA